MGLAIPSLKFILEKSRQYRFKGPLLTYGNQDIYADISLLNKWSKSSSNTFQKSTSLDLAQINQQAKNFIHAKTFFQRLGIQEKDYFDVDKFNYDQPKIVHDLEKPFPKKYHNFFSFIIDSGTLEHIFDIRAVMENTVKITKLGGYVLHFIPANNFLNHGFYQISPTFFHDFYTANGFKVVESYLTEIRPNCHRFHYYHQKAINNKFFINPYSRLASVFLLKKIKNVDQVISPTQFAYQNVSRKKKHFGTLTDTFRKHLPFKYHSLFFLPWVIFNQLFSKKEYFDIDFS